MTERSRNRRKDTKQKELHKKIQNHRIKKAVFLILGIILLGIVGYCGFDRIMDGRTMGCRLSIFGVNVSWLSPDDAADKVIREFQNTDVVFKEDGKKEYHVTLGEAGYSLDRSSLVKELETVKNNRQPCRILFEKRKDVTVPYQVIWDDSAMKSAFSGDHIKESREREGSVDAYITFNEETRRYEIVPSVLGTVIDNGKLLNQIQKTLNDSFSNELIQNSITVDVGTDVYQTAEVTETQTALNTKLAELNHKIEGYENAQVTYTFGSVEEVLDNATIQSWVQIDQDNISLNESAIRDYIDQLSADYNTQYVPRHFTTSFGNEVIISNNEYGYWIDPDGEYEQLCSDLESGEPVKREPVYKAKGIGREGNDDLIEGYVEVDLTNQHLWLYYQGDCKMDTDVVTGQPVGINTKTGEQENWSTYQGSFPIAYTEHPGILSSDIYGYEVEVQYWMPFVYGQGLHDATWRGAFGGEIYKTDGSHGCVNLSLDAAATIYDYVDTGFPVIIYE